MNVQLPPDLEALVQSKVDSGLFSNRGEVVREALRLLAEQDRLRSRHLAHLRRSVAKGLAEANRGELLDGSEVKRAMQAWVRNQARPS